MFDTYNAADSLDDTDSHPTARWPACLSSLTAVLLVFAAFCAPASAQNLAPTTVRALEFTMSPTQLRCGYNQDRREFLAFESQFDEVILLYMLEHIRNGQVIGRQLDASPRYQLTSGDRVHYDPAWSDLTFVLQPGDQVRIRAQLLEIDESGDDRELLSAIQDVSEVISTVGSAVIPAIAPILQAIDLVLDILGYAWDFLDWLNQNDDLGEASTVLTPNENTGGTVKLTVSSWNQGAYTYDWFYTATFAIGVAAVAPWTHQLVGDFDNDGHEDDIASYNPQDDSMFVSIANSNGQTFQTSLWAQLYSAPYSAHLAGDFDGDGYLDDIASIASDGTIWVSFSDQNGFDTYSWGSLPSPEHYSSHHVGDFDGDGDRDDIASYRALDGTLQLNRSQAGRFLRSSAGSVGSEKPLQVAGDFNGDGRDDLACYCPLDSSIRVYTSTGYSLAASNLRIQYSTANSPSVFRVGDFDGDDRDDDIAAHETTDGRWVVSRSNGSSFSSSTWADFGTPDGWVSQLVGDFDHNGRDDISNLHSSGTVWVCRSLGNSFSTSHYETMSPIDGYRQLIGDFDNDGFTDDLASLHMPTEDWHVSTTTGYSFDTSEWPWSQRGWSTASYSQGQLVAWAQLPGVRLISGMFNHDNYADFALIGGATWTSVPVALGNGNGTFNIANFGASQLANVARQSGVKIVGGDHNGDGLTDLTLVGGAGSDQVHIALAAGNGTWGFSSHPASTLATWAAMPSVHVVSGDFDGDGDDDLALAGGPGWNTVPVAFSKRNGSYDVTNAFVPDVPSWATMEGVKLVVGNFDGDHDDDIAITGGLGWDTVPVAFSNSNGTFNVTNRNVSHFPALASERAFNFGYVSHRGAAVFAGDVNGDGFDDLTVAAGSSSEIAIAISSGDGNFEVPAGQETAAASTAYHHNAELLGGDVNGDGLSDVMIIHGNYLGDRLTTAFRNMQDPAHLSFR